MRLLAAAVMLTVLALCLEVAAGAAAPTTRAGGGAGWTARRELAGLESRQPLPKEDEHGR